MGQAAPESITSVPCHLEGLTKLCFSPDGSTIFTGGTDCLVRIHKADEPDSEPGFHDNHTDAVTTLTCSSSHLITGSTDNIVRQFSYPENDFQGFVTRSAGIPIRWVSVDKQGERVAVCSDDLLVKIVHVNDTSRVALLSDNTKSARSATWDPSGKYLTTVSCDGKLKIYDTTASTPLCLKIMDGVVASSESDSTTSCYAAWHPSGNFFVVPTRTNDIVVIGREGWSKQAAFSLDGSAKMGNGGELAWSPNGRYLASSAGSQILVWSTETRQIIARYDNLDSAITSLSFSPISNLLAFTALDGTFYRWTDPIPSSLPSPVTSEAAEKKKLDKLLDDGSDNEDDIEERGENIDDEYGDDWIIDDDGGGFVEKEEKWGAGRTEVVNVTKAQPSFTPGSTVMKNKKRYLDFNMIGVIDVTDQETHNVVNVEFHDKSARRGYHFQDHSKYTMASLGERGIVYAASGEGEQASLVHYRAYDSWTSHSDWQMALLPGEDALLVASGGSSDESATGSVIVATSKGFVRFLSSSGIQRYIWRLGEEAVSMAAGKENVLIVHREGGTSLDGCQNLRYSLMDLETFDLLQEGRVPLPKKTTLVWIGFTADGAPAMYDSAGLLSVLDRFRRPGQARWVPLLDSKSLPRKEGKQETYWPVGVTSTHFTCVILKGSDKEPWFPRPLIQELDMHMPLLNMDNQQGKLEESLVRGEIHLSTLRESLDPEAEYTIKEREVALDKEMLQLVQGACKADNLHRALDITRLMHNAGTLEAASKVAAFYHLPGLQERIQGVQQENEGKRRKAARSRKDREAKAALMEFQPRVGGAKRAFGGVGVRDSTPAMTGRSETVIPETPRDELDEREPSWSRSPETKRKRDGEEEGVENQEFKAPMPKKPTSEFPLTTNAPKNPFAKKPPPSNPFAKAAVAKPLDSVKSTSFFERVDNIEQDTRTKASAKPKPSKGKGGKQTTLFGLPGADKEKSRMMPPKPPQPFHMDSSVSTETDGSEFEETQTQTDDRSILEETQVQETASPEPMLED
ncbi:chromosome transmission fidelity protein 4, partial [Tremellales sp. Uapishka_1]